MRRWAITQGSSKRALDLTKLLLPYEPTEILGELTSGKAKNPNANISSIHFFHWGH